MTKIFLWLLLIGIAYLMFLGFKRDREIKKNGIVTNAVVTRIEEVRDVDEDGTSISYDYYVQYQMPNGQIVEAKLGKVPKRTVIGNWLVIKYLPDRPDYVLPAK